MDSAGKCQMIHGLRQNVAMVAAANLPGSALVNRSAIAG